jgi:non-ribosomal peptide synthetase-like protein
MLGDPCFPMMLRGPSRPDLLRTETLSELLRTTARRIPEKTALLWEDRQVSYGELLQTGERLAGSLRQRGLHPGQVVGLWLPRGADLLLAQAGIALHGAAWLPFDAETPPERIATCLADAQACGILTTRSLAPRLRALGLTVWDYEELSATPAPATPAETATPDDPAYVIYTSGSTGQPKGIVITQRNICHLLRSENALLGVREEDLVYQGFSVAFDMSFEEIWISYLVGATLWIAPAELVGDPETLAATLQTRGITVIHAVPTLMGLIEAPLPKVRLINLGGEPCPEGLVGRLARPGRQLFNTYGPTETSVTATMTALTPGEAVTIGRPLPNYGVLVVDADRRPVPVGEVGELAIFGPGLAAGYLGRPELTAARFIPNPLASDASEARMYLSGDLARIDPAGVVRCLGRVDDQVKIRGFRVELGEIETHLGHEPGVAAAAVVLRPVAGIDQLVGFVVRSPGATGGPDDWRRSLAAKLPPYMVPAQVEVLTEMPRLTSGKTDRRQLQQCPLGGFAPTAASAPRDEEERALFAILARLMPGLALRPEADFFRDLGGHSLLAARLVSALRQTPAYARLGVGDLYRERTLEKFAQAMAAVRARTAGTVGRRPRQRIDGGAHLLCGLAQALCLPLLILWHISSWLAPFFTYHFFTGEPDDSIGFAVVASLGVFVMLELASFVVAIAGKRLLLGRLRPGRYPLWGVTYFRFWLSEKLTLLAPVRLLHGTGWMNLYLRLLGAQIGRQVFIDSLVVSVPELLVVGDGADLGSAILIANARVEGGELVVGPVTIGPEALVESNTVLENDVHLGAGATLEAMSCAPAGTSLPPRETWCGSPPRRVDRLRTVLPPRPAASWWRRALRLASFAVVTLAIACLFFLPVFPTFMLIDALDARYIDIFETDDLGTFAAFGLFFLLAIPASALLVGGTIVLTAALRRLLIAPQVAGRWAIAGPAYFRKWLVTRVLDASLETLHGLYASVFAAGWLRLMGAHVGANTEISTATGVSPDLLRLGQDSFVADGVMLGDEEQRGGWMTLQTTSVGDRTFLGNGAYVGAGAALPDDVLIGVQTRTPDNATLRPGQVWLGSPAVLLPAREGDPGFDPRLTFRPSRGRWLARATIETLRIVLPMAFVIATGYLVVHATMPFAEEERWTALAGALAVAGCLYGLASFLLILALKWTLVGRYRPTARPMWSLFVWTSEAVTSVYEALAVPNFLDFLRGTPLLPWALRLLGTRLGRRVYLDTTDITEFDCVTIGDEAELNAHCGPQTHLFEDRVMKIGEVRIGDRVSVGPASTILYDTDVGADVRLGPLTLVAKGERLPADTDWIGSPAAPAR